MPETKIRTLADLPFHVSGRYPKPVLLRRCRTDGYDEFSTRQFFEDVRDCGLGLAGLGVKSGDRVAIICETRPEWLIADLAILSIGAVTVPIYPTLTTSMISFVLIDAGVRVVIVSTADQAEKVREIRSELPALEKVIVIEAKNIEEDESSLAEIIKHGHGRLMHENGLAREYKETAGNIGVDQLATVIYTSGTTGNPKGVMLTHGAVVANVVDAEFLVEFMDTDEALSFLPLSHVLERSAVYLYLYRGVSITFAESLETIGRDMVRVKPTVMTGVPRVFDKLHARIIDGVRKAPAIRRILFLWALAVSRKRSRKMLAGHDPSFFLRVQHVLADRLVCVKIRERVGGKLRFVISGGAPLSRDVAEFLFAVGIPILEGYGLTETAPVLTINPETAPRIGTVGKAMPRVKLRIATDGEILASGPNLMIGYYNQPQATAEVIKEGWFHTGDIGHLDDDGYLTITDRKKEILVTSGGKNIAPQPIELRLKQHPLVSEAMLIGDGKRFVSALIIPDFSALRTRIGSVSEDDFVVLVERFDVKAMYDDIVNAVNDDLPQYEQLKRFALLPTEFSQETGELTPTMKLKRRVVLERWKSVVNDLYSD